MDSYFASIAKRATSIDIPTDAVTYLTDDPSHAIEAGKKYGIKMLSPEEARRVLSYFKGLGATPQLGQRHQHADLPDITVK